MVHCKEANIVLQGITRNGAVKKTKQKSRGLVPHECCASRVFVEQQYQGRE